MHHAGTVERITITCAENCYKVGTYPEAHTIESTRIISCYVVTFYSKNSKGGMVHVANEKDYSLLPDCIDSIGAPINSLDFAIAMKTRGRELEEDKFLQFAAGFFDKTLSDIIVRVVAMDMRSVISLDLENGRLTLY